MFNSFKNITITTKELQADWLLLIHYMVSVRIVYKIVTSTTSQIDTKF